jgi:hypothetical protein
MKKRWIGLFLMAVLLMGFTGTSLAAASAPPLPFGEEIHALTEEEMAEVEGAFGVTLAKTAVGAAVGGVSYLITTPQSSWNWSDGLRHCVAGAVSGLLGSFF